MESDNKPNDGVQPEGLSGQAAPSSPSPSESKEKQQPTTSGPNFQGDLPFRHPNPEDTLGSLTESHGEPSQKVLPIDGDIVQSWIKVLLEDRFVVLRGIDENVLFAAEHLVAKEHREKVPGLAVRRAILPGRPYRPIGRNETSKETAKTVPESDQCTIQMLSVANSEATPLLLIVQAYGRIDPSGFLDSLPSNRNELHTIQHGLGHHDRYILVLTKPEFLGVTNFRRELRSYAEPVDFLEPRLKHEFRDRPDLTKSLLKQREAELWWKVEDNHRTDEKFFQEVIDALQRKYLVELIDAGTSALQDKDPKQSFKTKREEIEQRRKKRKEDWPDTKDFLEQVLLFVAAFLEDLPVADFDRVVRAMLGDRSVRRPVPMREVVHGESAKEVVQMYKDFSLCQLWSDSPEAYVQKCGLRMMVRGGVPIVTCQDKDETEQIRLDFAEKYPFTFTELWRRMLAEGLLFDESDDVSRQFIRCVVDRVAQDPTRFGQDFLYEILRSGQVLGRGDEENSSNESPSGLLDEVHWFIAQIPISALLSSMLYDHRTRDLVGPALGQLIDWRVPGLCLQFLRRLSVHPSFSVGKRLELAWKILNQSGKTYWAEVERLLKRWATTPSDAYEAIAIIINWLPREGANPTSQVLLATGVLASVFEEWLSGPNPGKHPLCDILTSQSEEKVLKLLIKWMLHPAVERVLEVRAYFRFIDYWLLAEHARMASGDGEDRILRLRVDLLQQYNTTLPVMLGTGLRLSSTNELPAVRLFQSTIIVDWAAAAKRMDTATKSTVHTKALVFQLTDLVGDVTTRQIWSILRAMDKATLATLPNPKSLDPQGVLLKGVRESFVQARQLWGELQQQWTDSVSRKPNR